MFNSIGSGSKLALSLDTEKRRCGDSVFRDRKREEIWIRVRQEFCVFEKKIKYAPIGTIETYDFQRICKLVINLSPVISCFCHFF